MIYLAGPLFTAAEREFNKLLAFKLRKILNKKIFIPQDECNGLSNPEEIFLCCKNGLDNSEIIVAILDGPDSDSGTCFEVGYAFALGKPVIGARTDFRLCGDDGGLNLMLSQSCKKIILQSSLSNSSIDLLAEKISKEI